MTGGMQMQYAAVDRGLAVIDDAAERLATDRARIDDRVDGFLRSGWRGAAADAFDAAWLEWVAAADDVRHGLVSMGELLRAVRHDFAVEDDTTATRLGEVAGRVVQRLG